MHVAEFLKAHADEAFLLPEIVARLKQRQVDVETVLAALEAGGQIFREVYPLSDPHLPPDLMIVTWLAADDDAARARIARVYERWFREFSATHRCA